MRRQLQQFLCGILGRQAMHDDVIYWKWLSKVLGTAAQNVNDILEFVEHDAKIAYAQIDFLYAQKRITKGQFAHCKQFTLEDVQTELENEIKHGVTVIGFSDDRYPDLLRNISSPPLVLHVKGDIAHLQAPVAIGVVGTRRPSAYGSESIDYISAGLAEAGVMVVSGLAAGLDSVAHKAAITRDLPTIAVVGGGLDVYYPSANKKLQQLIEKYGTVVSEYSLGERPERHHFLERNRIIAGLSHGLCVAEARKHSGTMSTVRYALEAGRDVFAIPGSIFSPLSDGTNALIKEGAYCVTSAEDILQVYGIHIEQEDVKEEKPMKKVDLSGISKEAKQLYACITREEKVLAQICEECKLAAGAALAALSELEMEGLVHKLPGQRYVLAI